MNCTKLAAAGSPAGSGFAMLDVFAHGDVVDGTGAPRRRADVGIRDAASSASATDEPATRAVDVTSVVRQVHRHPRTTTQLLWDPIQPVTAARRHDGMPATAADRPDGRRARRYAMRMMSRRGQSCIRSIRSQTWRTFGDYLAFSTARPASTQVSSSATPSSLVMGDDAVGGTPTQTQIVRWWRTCTSTVAGRWPRPAR
jgi:N-acyl-D-aspartate/D-glutamate deacylase